MKSKISLRIAVLFAAFLVYGSEGGQPSRWRWSLGPSYRSGADLKIDGDSYSDSSMIPNRARGGLSGPRATGVGNELQIEDREYDDGFVRPFPLFPDSSLTCYWGYDHSDQYRNGRLYFRANDGILTEFKRSVQSRDAVSPDAEQAWGLQIQGERYVYRKGNMGIGILAGLSGHSFSFQSKSSTFQDIQNWNVYQQYIEDSYDLEGQTPPDAPFAFDPSSIPPRPRPGDLIGMKRWLWWKLNQKWIDILPDRNTRRELIGRHQYAAWNEVTHSLDLNVYVFGLGASMEWTLKNWIFTLAGGPTLSLVESDAVYREELLGQMDQRTVETLGSWREQEQESFLAAGAFVQAQAGADITSRGLGLYIFARYDWVQSINGKVGPSLWDADLDGGSAGLLVRMPF